MAELSKAFLSRWLGSTEGLDEAALEHALSRIRAQLHARRGPVLDAFWTELARCIPDDIDGARLPQAVADVRADDLCLALRCREGDPQALRRFDAEIVDRLPESLAGFGIDGDRMREIQQRVRIKLFVGGQGPPRIAHYRGQMALWRWVRAVAAREAINMKRTDDREEDIGSLSSIALEATGPELGLVRDEYGAAFERAFRSALGALEPADRNLLRLHYKHGLTIDQLAPMLRLHRASVARRIHKCRERLAARTRNVLQLELKISRVDFEQAVAALIDRLDLTLTSSG